MAHIVFKDPCQKTKLTDPAESFLQTFPLFLPRRGTKCCCNSQGLIRHGGKKHDISALGGHFQCVGPDGEVASFFLGGIPELIALIALID